MNKEYNSWSIEKGDYHRHNEKNENIFTIVKKEFSEHSGLLIFIALIVSCFYLIIKYIF